MEEVIASYQDMLVAEDKIQLKIDYLKRNGYSVSGIQRNIFLVSKGENQFLLYLE